MHFNLNIFKQRINALSSLWEKELKPFVLTDIVDLDFKTVKEFVLERVMK